LVGYNARRSCWTDFTTWCRPSYRLRSISMVAMLCKNRGIYISGFFVLINFLYICSVIRNGEDNGKTRVEEGRSGLDSW
jgi:hypothetical protein